MNLLMLEKFGVQIMMVVIKRDWLQQIIHQKMSVCLLIVKGYFLLGKSLLTAVVFIQAK